ncbi:MAG: ABC transporter permease [Mycobacteriaceae bacterium]
MSVFAAERIKLISTKSPWWCSGLAAFFGIGFAVLQAFTSKSSNPMIEGSSSAYYALQSQNGVIGLSSMVVMIMSALAITTEYRFGVIRTTFQAVPNRTLVMGTKAVLLALISGVLGLVVSGIAYVSFMLIMGQDLNIDSTGARSVFGAPLYLVLVAVLAVAIGALVRQSAAAISLLLLWPIMEGIFSAIPWVDKHIAPWGPFNNIGNFLGQSGIAVEFGPWGSLVYFMIFVAVIFVAGLVVVNKRDA